MNISQDNQSNTIVENRIIENSIIENINNAEANIKKLKQIYTSNEYKNIQNTNSLITSLWEQFLNKRLENLNKNTLDFLNIYDKIKDFKSINSEILLTLLVLNSSTDLNI